MYRHRPDAKLPDDLNTPIWRYMDFTKFVSMLETGALFFCRPDCLDDRFEGKWGRASIKEIEQDLRRRQAEGQGIEFGSVEYQLRGVKLNFEEMRKVLAVNCWHLSSHESAAMWRLYVYAHQGLAICSTTAKFIESIPNDKTLPIHIGVVNYIDYDTDAIPLKDYLAACLCKRKSFEHERELRAVAYKLEVTESPGRYTENIGGEFEKPGEHVVVNLSTLISSIHLAPGSPAWMEPLVKSVARRYGLDVPVKRSKLDDKPV